MKPKASVPEKLADFCTLGSLICKGGLPKHIRDQVGSSPHPGRVAMPRGTLTLRGLQDAAYRALRKVTGKSLRAIYLQHPKLWTPEFKAALKAAQKKGLDWPVDKAGRKWQVHHKRPLDFGGDNSPNNLVALEPDVHVDFTNYWNGVKRAFRDEFDDAAHWDRIIGGDENAVYVPPAD